jgi:hypothetical protein
MDTKLIQQYGEDIRCYRLRTARQKKRMQYKDFDKQLIQLHKKENALYLQHRNLGWEPLLPPVQKGWIRHFVVRDDVAKSKYGEFFEAILKKINTFDYDWKKDFKRKRKRRGKKIYVVKPQYLLRPYPFQFQKMEFTEIEKQFFREVWEMDSKRRVFKRYEFAEPWRFVLKIRPNMIDKVRVKDALLESKIKVLDNYVERNDLRKKMCRLIHGHYKYRDYEKDEKFDEVSEFKSKSLTQILNSIKDE